VNQAEFNDPRLVAVYDAVFGWASDDDFFLAVASESGSSRVLDLGCGTGRLTLAMAAAGHTVTGVDPLDRTWERWNPVDSRRAVAMPDGTLVEMWTEVTAVRDGLVDSTIRYRFPDAAELVSTATLRFRSGAELRGSLQALGLSVETVYGGWGREPVGQGDGELLVIARA
jgi:SAM-dependent methyltransferase